MDHPIYRAATAERDRLKRELLAGDQAAKFRLYLKAEEVIRMYQDVDTPVAEAPRPESRQPQGDNEAARVVAAAKEVLKERGHRMMSGPMAEILTARGVQIGGKNKASRVSAYMSAARDTFDNIRGQGYGLRNAIVAAPDLLPAHTNGHAGAH